MPRKKSVNKETVESVATTTFEVLPLMRKKLLRMDVVQAEHNMPMSHVQVLTMLGDVGAMSVSEISKRLGIAKPNITPLIDRLIADGYVERRRDVRDRRVVNIVLLESGREKLAAIRATICSQIQAQAGTLSVSEFRELSESLASVVRILSSL